MKEKPPTFSLAEKERRVGVGKFSVTFRIPFTYLALFLTALPLSLFPLLWLLGKSGVALSLWVVIIAWYPLLFLLLLFQLL